MENDAEDASSSRVSSRESSAKDFNVSRGSLQSTDKVVTPSKGPVKISTKNDEKHKETTFAGADPSAKVPKKMIMNWKHACDRTRDRTRDLLKRWRTLPEGEEADNVKNHVDDNVSESDQLESGWSVHVWTTWVDRLSVDEMERCESDSYVCKLTPIQKNKFSHFFKTLLDHDQDELINQQDLESLIERLRHFADWSTHSPEYNILREIERGFIDTFLDDITEEKFGFIVNCETYLTIDGWMFKWSQLIGDCKDLYDFPIWLQYFVKALFQVINKSGNGVIDRDELKLFYSSVLGLETFKVNEVLDPAYNAMTSNGDHLLNFKTFRLCFSNYLLGRYPNGPGQFMFGATLLQISSTLFPVDYSALNALPDDLEQYAPDHKTNRRSVIV